MASSHPWSASRPAHPCAGARRREMRFNASRVKSRLAPALLARAGLLRQYIHVLLRKRGDPATAPALLYLRHPCRRHRRAPSGFSGTDCDARHRERCRYPRIRASLHCVGVILALCRLLPKSEKNPVVGYLASSAEATASRGLASLQSRDGRIRAPWPVRAAAHRSRGWNSPKGRRNGLRRLRSSTWMYCLSNPAAARSTGQFGSRDANQTSASGA